MIGSIWHTVVDVLALIGAIVVVILIMVCRVTGSYDRENDL